MRLAGTGHRPDKLGGYTRPFQEPSPVELRVRAAIRDAFFELKPDAVMSGMALGFDTWLAQEALGLGIPLHAAVPFEGQELRWPEYAQTVYRKLLKRCTAVTFVSNHHNAHAFQVRNVFMVDWLTMRGDDVLLTCWDGSGGGTFNCLQYAEYRKARVRRIDPATLKP